MQFRTDAISIIRRILSRNTIITKANIHMKDHGGKPPKSGSELTCPICKQALNSKYFTSYLGTRNQNETRHD